MSALWDTPTLYLTYADITALKEGRKITAQTSLGLPVKLDGREYAQLLTTDEFSLVGELGLDRESDRVTRTQPDPGEITVQKQVP